MSVDQVCSWFDKQWDPKFTLSDVDEIQEVHEFWQQKESQQRVPLNPFQRQCFEKDLKRAIARQERKAPWYTMYYEQGNKFTFGQAKEFQKILDSIDSWKEKTAKEQKEGKDYVAAEIHHHQVAKSRWDQEAMQKVDRRPAAILARKAKKAAKKAKLEQESMRARRERFQKAERERLLNAVDEMYHEQYMKNGKLTRDEMLSYWDDVAEAMCLPNHFAPEHALEMLKKWKEEYSQNH